MIRGTVMINILPNLYLHHIQIIGGTLISVNGDPDERQCFGDFYNDGRVAWASILARVALTLRRGSWLVLRIFGPTGECTRPCRPDRRRVLRNANGRFLRVPRRFLGWAARNPSSHLWLRPKAAQRSLRLILRSQKSSPGQPRDMTVAL